MNLKEILYISTPEKAINYKWEKGAEYLNRNVQIVSLDDLEEVDNKIIIDKSEGIYEGMTFVKHPFMPNKYINLHNAEKEILFDKSRALGLVASCLGAKKISSEIILQNVKELKINSNNEIEAKAIDIKADLDYESLKKDLEKYKIDETYSGILSVKSYEEAKDQMKKYNLVGNGELEYILSQRDPLKTNLLLSRKVEMEISNEYNSLLGSAFSLNYLDTVFKLSTNFKKKTSTQKNIKIIYTIDF